MSDTTSIFDLPAEPANNGGNVNLSINEKTVENTIVPNGMSLDQNTINQIISGLQQASTSGITQLISRDIPTTTNQYTHDPSIQPDYIPKPVNIDYIKDDEQTTEIINKHNNSNNSNLDNLYDEIQVPLLIGVLFFLFQLPVFKKILYKYFPILFFKEGNVNIYGYSFMSVLFSVFYYLIHKIMTNII